MKKSTILFFLFINISFSYAQDVIVLKKDEQEVKCKIISVDNMNITYHQWNSEDKSVHSVRRVDVLSYFLENTSVNSSEGNSDIDSTEKKQGFFKMKNSSEGKSRIGKEHEILAMYHSGEMVSGYVVLNSGDTIPGIISVKNVAENQLSVKFKNEKSVDFIYSTSDLIAYGYGEVTYKKIKLKFKGDVTNNKKSEDGYHFLHLEVDGPAKLYRFYQLIFKQSLYLNYNEPPFFLGRLKTNYLVINPHGKSIFTKGRTIKGTINRLLSDNVKLIEKINTKTPKESDFPEIIRSYNSWFNNKN